MKVKSKEDSIEIIFSEKELILIERAKTYITVLIENKDTHLSISEAATARKGLSIINKAIDKANTWKKPYANYDIGSFIRLCEKIDLREFLKES